MKIVKYINATLTFIADTIILFFESMIFLMQELKEKATWSDTFWMMLSLGLLGASIDFWMTVGSMWYPLAPRLIGALAPILFIFFVGGTWFASQYIIAHTIRGCVHTYKKLKQPLQQDGR